MNEQIIITAPESPQLPSFLLPSHRYNEARASLATALIVEAEAKRMADIARNFQLGEALDCLEKQVGQPFQKLLDADECYFEDHGTKLMTDEEQDYMDCIASDVKRMIQSRRFPDFDPHSSNDIRDLLRKYADAIAEQKGMCDDPEDRNSHIWPAVWRHMIAANAQPVRTAE